MAAPRFPTSATADGTTKDFLIGFPLLDAKHLRVTDNDTIKVLNTDYVVLDVMLDGPVSAQQPTVRFLTAPTNAHTLKFYRNTPIGTGFRPTLVISNLLEKLARYRQEEIANDGYLSVGGAGTGDFGQTKLLAPTALTFIAPCDGYVDALDTLVTGVVTTGGTIAVSIAGVAVTGLSATIANSAAVGANQRVNPTTAQSATTKVQKGQVISVTPASFATAGNVRVEVRIQQADF